MSLQLPVSQQAQAQGERGFVQNAPAIANGEELNRQPDLWVMELQLKPMRMTWVEVTDPETGETSREQIWYLAYRTLNRRWRRAKSRTTRLRSSSLTRSRVSTV